MTGMWFTSDLHIGHNLVARLRGFEDTAEHDAFIATQWDRNIKPRDQVWVLGDLAIGAGRASKNALQWVSERPGIKHLISGNHDSTFTAHRGWHNAYRDYLQVFASINDRGVLRVAGHVVLMSHFPYTQGGDHTEIERYTQWRFHDHGLYLLHGHTHSDKQVTKNRQLHVGLDAHNLKPVPLSWVVDQVTNGGKHNNVDSIH